MIRVIAQFGPQGWEVMQHWPADWVSLALTEGAAAYEAGQRLARQDDLTLTEGIQTGTVSLETPRRDAPPPTVGFAPFQEARSRLLEARYGADFARYQADQQAYEGALRKEINIKSSKGSLVGEGEALKQEIVLARLRAQAVNPDAD